MSTAISHVFGIFPTLCSHPGSNTSIPVSSCRHCSCIPSANPRYSTRPSVESPPRCLPPGSVDVGRQTETTGIALRCTGAESSSITLGHPRAHTLVPRGKRMSLSLFSSLLPCFACQFRRACVAPEFEVDRLTNFKCLDTGGRPFFVFSAAAASFAHPTTPNVLRPVTVRFQPAAQSQLICLVLTQVCRRHALALPAAVGGTLDPGLFDLVPFF
ncbi:hypothetical protein F5148DRAFT_49260 [Russula earlei]|uniref:Uncharacterized protein n=1 Tax=Russula earlei TaxID=71964 RepID=A0ACC0TR68_9AGAM|nr:hypothetical protein F5148DRAFT_49260 [Russula earlei]